MLFAKLFSRSKSTSHIPTKFKPTFICCEFLSTKNYTENIESKLLFWPNNLKIVPYIKKFCDLN